MPDDVGKRIVVGVDGSTASNAALAWAADQAALTGVTLHAITTWEWPRSYGVVLTYPGEFNPEADADAVQAESLGVVRVRHSDLVVTHAVVEGRAAPTLVTASRGAVLLVVGSRGHGEFAGMLLGSVSEYCATSAHCPVLIHRGP